MKVFIDKPLNLRGRFDILVAAFIMRDFTGWWPVLLRGRSGPLGAASDTGPDELVLAPGPVARVDPIEEAYRLGREHERTDVVDFIENPPGRIPEGARQNLAELRKALASGAHEGWGKPYDVATPAPKAPAEEP